jgi:hypothetical protein
MHKQAEAMRIVGRKGGGGNAYDTHACKHARKRRSSESRAAASICIRVAASVRPALVRMCAPVDTASTRRLRAQAYTLDAHPHCSAQCAIYTYQSIDESESISLRSACAYGNRRPARDGAAPAVEPGEGRVGRKGGEGNDTHACKHARKRRSSESRAAASICIRVAASVRPALVRMCAPVDTASTRRLRAQAYTLDGPFCCCKTLHTVAEHDVSLHQRMSMILSRLTPEDIPCDASIWSANDSGRISTFADHFYIALN